MSLPLDFHRFFKARQRRLAPLEVRPELIGVLRVRQDADEVGYAVVGSILVVGPPDARVVQQRLDNRLRLSSLLHSGSNYFGH
jgi:hypothetical protein